VYFVAHTELQLTPPGLLLTVPAPLALTVRIWDETFDEDAGPLVVTAVGARMPAKVAVTVTGTFPTMVQGSVPLQPPPDQPLKTDPTEGIAVSVSTVAFGKVAEQSVPHLIPSGLLPMVPPTVPAFATVRANPPAGLPQAGMEKLESPALLNAAT
jgi:hypothetical protein